MRQCSKIHADAFGNEETAVCVAFLCNVWRSIAREGQCQQDQRLVTPSLMPDTPSLAFGTLPPKTIVVNHCMGSLTDAELEGSVCACVRVSARVDGRVLVCLSTPQRLGEN